MIGIGVDIVNVNRIADTIERSGDIFLRRVFSAAEIARGRQSDGPAAFFATAFAAKEAVFKALTLSWEPGVDFRNIEVSRGAAGEPLVALSGQVETIARARGCTRIMLSLSYESDSAIALVVLTSTA